MIKKKKGIERGLSWCQRHCEDIVPHIPNISARLHMIPVAQLLTSLMAAATEPVGFRFFPPP